MTRTAAASLKPRGHGSDGARRPVPGSTCSTSEAALASLLVAGHYGHGPGQQLRNRHDTRHDDHPG